MKGKRFTEGQIVAILKEGNAGAPTKDLCRRHGICEAHAAHSAVARPLPDPEPQTVTHSPNATKLTVKPIMKLPFAALCGMGLSIMTAYADTLSVDGVHVVQQVQSTEMQYRRKPDFSLGARVEVFLRNVSPETAVIPATADVRLRGQTPEELLQADEWAWHDLPSAWGGDPLHLPPGATTVWSWNGKRAAWGTNTQAELAITLPGAGEAGRCAVRIDNPSAWLSAVTFLGAGTNVQPDSLIFHLANRTSGPLRLEACRLWLPEKHATWRELIPQPCISNRLDRFPAEGRIPANDRGGARVATGPLPLTYATLEVILVDVGGEAGAFFLTPGD